MAAKNIGVGSLLAELTKRPVANYTRLSWGAVSIFLLYEQASTMGSNKRASNGMCAMFCVFCCYDLANPFILLVNVQAKGLASFSCLDPANCLRWR